MCVPLTNSCLPQAGFISMFWDNNKNPHSSACSISPSLRLIGLHLLAVDCSDGERRWRHQRQDGVHIRKISKPCFQYRTFISDWRFNNYSTQAPWIVGNSPIGAIPHYSRSLSWIIVWIYTTREHSKNKQDNTFCRDIFFSLANKAQHFGMKTISPSLRSRSWDIAQYPKKANRSNCAILGGSRVAHTNEECPDALLRARRCLSLHNHVS